MSVLDGNVCEHGRTRAICGECYPGKLGVVGIVTPPGPDTAGALRLQEERRARTERRERIATAVLGHLIGTTATPKIAEEMARRYGHVDGWREAIAIGAVSYADALIAELDK